jgi:hypothetical protein
MFCVLLGLNSSVADISLGKPADGIWQTYVPQSDADTNRLCKHNTGNGTSEGISGTNLKTIWPLRLQGVLCQFLNEGFTGHGGPVSSRSLMGVSFYNKDGENGIQVRLKWSGKVDQSWRTR